MDVSRRKVLAHGAAGAGLLAALGSAGPLLAKNTAKPASDGDHGTTGPEVVTAARALDLLKAGNRAFIQGRRSTWPIDSQQRRRLAVGQHPFAVVVCCSDSRVAPELLFNAGLGQLFVIRNAGSTAADDHAIGSIEYAVEHLHVPLVVVLGHSKCGAVSAATDVVLRHAELGGHLAGMVEPIVPAVLTAQKMGGDLIQHAVEENILNVVHALSAPSQPILSPLLRRNRIRIVGAEYMLDTGEVLFLSE